MSKEAMKQALELIRAWERGCDSIDYGRDIAEGVKALEDALASQEKQGVGGFKRHRAAVVYNDPLKDAAGGFEALVGVLEQPARPNKGLEAEMLLKRCLDEMRYAGWDEPLKDNACRGYVFCDVFLYLQDSKK